MRAQGRIVEIGDELGATPAKSGGREHGSLTRHGLHMTGRAGDPTAKRTQIAMPMATIPTWVLFPAGNGSPRLGSIGGAFRQCRAP